MKTLYLVDVQKITVGMSYIVPCLQDSCPRLKFHHWLSNPFKRTKKSHPESPPFFSRGISPLRTKVTRKSLVSPVSLRAWNLSTMDAIITGHTHFNWSVCKPVYSDYRSSRQGDALFGLCCKTIPMSVSNFWVGAWDEATIQIPGIINQAR